MRLSVPRDQRRPQPEPAVANEILAFAIGLCAWAVGLAVVVGMLSAPVAFDPARALTTIAVGLGLGIAGLIVSVARARARALPRARPTP